MKTLRELIIGVDGRGVIVLYWPSRRQFTLTIKDIITGEIEDEWIKDRADDRAWKLRGIIP